MNWRSIDEGERPDRARGEETILLLGILATRPEAYDRFYRPRRVLTPGALALFLERVIAWSAAAVAHVLLAALLMSLYLEIKGEDEKPLWAGLYEGKKPEAAKLVEPPRVEARKEEPKPPQPVPVPEPPKPEKPVVVTPEPEPPFPSPNPVAAAPAEVPKPAEVGAGASAAGTAARAAVTDREVEKDPAAAIRRRRAEDLEKLRGGSPAEIVVVAGCYDRVQEVLDRLDIPHRLIDGERLARADLSQCKALLVNCDNRWASYLMKGGDIRSLEKQIAELEEQEADVRKRLDRTREKQTVYKLNLLLMSITSEVAELRHHRESVSGSARTVDALRDFVKGGGSLFTSDWGLSILERVFPGYIRSGGTVGPRTVGIRARSGKEKHALLEGVFYAASKGSTVTERKFLWEIDSSSYLVRIDKPAVEILVESPELGRYPGVAVTFTPEGARGNVLHVLSHFQKQATKQGDFALQNMLLNFLVERARK